MSSACPKCGAEQTEIHGLYKCGTQKYNNPENNADIFFPYSVSAFCRGRAEAIAELDVWHTGEPEVCVNRINYECENPEDGVQVAWRDYDGQWLHFEREMHGNYVVAPFNGPFNKWREVRQ